MNWRSIGVAVALATLALGRLWAAPVQVLATGDMHGWIEPLTLEGQVMGGPGMMLAAWRAVEKYTPRKFLVVSCGDVATGPALSVMFKGQPAVDVMNLMGYDVCALGNHELDYGLDGLRNIKQWAKFPLLAGNLLNADGTEAGLTSGTFLYEEQGVKIGIIGLTTKDINSMANTGGLKVRPYGATVRALAPGLTAQGAQMLILVTHAPLGELTALAKEVAELNIPLILGGHSHEFGQMKIGNTWVVNNGEWWRGYTRIDLDYDPATGRTVVLTAKQVWLQQAAQRAKADPQISALVAGWRKRLPAEEQQPVGYTNTGLARTWALCNLVADSWLAAYPADVAICNRGGLRQDISPGTICRFDITGLMPFANSLLRLKLTGAQIAAYRPAGEALFYGGVRKQGARFFLLGTGQPLEPDRAYRVLINDFLYNTSKALQAADPQPEKVDPSWRAPLLRWLADHPTSKEKPLEGLIDGKARIE
ncbi:MAG: bifunctional metallophosphatase/5'-nucleotidase [Armatimonadota bacterium]